ncbi:MAG TPA: DUF3857 domain-containing protein [Acidobacteriota bacterium]|nr:DUF3857 domain-containing protein [Acidobacteriota bacterium]
MTPPALARPIGALLLALFAAAGAAGAAAERLPDWAQEAMAGTPPPEFETSDAVVLLREERVSEEGGRYRSLDRRIVRIVSSVGAREAVAAAYYNTDAGKVLSLRAWLVSPDGAVRRIPDKEAVDRAVLDGSVYDETRVRTLSASDDARPGSVFLFESDVEREWPFAQHEWWFQGALPTRISRFVLAPPAGWTVTFTVMGRDTIVPGVAAGVWTWELRDLPAVAEEPLRPPLEAVAARIAVNLVAPPGATGDATHRVVRRWQDASAWLAGRVSALGPPDDRVRAKAAALTAGLAGPEEKVRAIAGFAQSVNYVSIQMGIGRGGGYVPRPAGAVLARAYGDCKDKANLMRGLLEAAGIESHLVLICATEGEHVLPEFPALSQFDHCILAVRSDAAADAVVDHPTRGRLVLFDPTDPSTPWGSLPWREHGAWALPVMPEEGSLVRVPAAPAGSYRRTRTIDGSLDDAGLFTGSIRYETGGAAASDWRARIRSVGAKGIERERTWWLGPLSSAAVVDSFSVDAPREGAVRFLGRFRLPKVGSPMAGRLLVVDSGRLTTLRVPVLPDTPRVYPIEIDSDRFEEEIVLRLPAGFEPDEVPGPVTLETAFGSIRCAVTEEAGLLRIRRSLESRASVLPPEAYADARRFYSRARDVFGVAIVLARR